MTNDCVWISDFNYHDRFVSSLVLRSAHKKGLVPMTSPYNYPPEEFTQRDWSQGLVPRTVHMKRFEEQVAGTCPKNSNWFEFMELVIGTKVGPCD